MTRRHRVYAQPISYFNGMSPSAPYQASSGFPIPQAARPPIPFSPPNPPFPPYLGTPLPPPTSLAQSDKPGMGGVIKNLLKGQGSLNLQSMLTYAQKVIGVVNQLGTVVRNMSPMLEMIKGFSDSSLFKDDNPPQGKRTKRRKVRKRKKTGQKRELRPAKRGKRRTNPTRKKKVRVS